jgi:hypothetical protein
MSTLTVPIEATQDVIASAAVSADDLARAPALETEAAPPVLITEQEVIFGTAVALQPPSIPTTRRMVGVLRAVATALRPPPPRPHYARRAGYLESAAMSREMGRL